MIVTLTAGLAGSALGATYQLLDGSQLNGEAISFNPDGLVVKRDDGTFSPRVSWTNFTMETLSEIAKLPQAKRFVEPFLFDEEEEPVKKALAEIRPKPVPRLTRADTKAGWGALFASPLSIALLAIVYLANLYAAFEVSIFRNYPALLVCGVAAVLPVVGPAVFLFLPTHLARADAEEDEYVPEQYVEADVPVAETAVAGGHGSTAPSAPVAVGSGGKVPPPMVYQRGAFTFNRRFFETKLAGFLRMVPSDEEKDMVVCIKSARGEHVGARISRIMPNELYLQVTKSGASSDVLIPFGEISEVQVRHKDFQK